MSALHNNPFLLASGSPTDPTFPVQRSVRLRSSASAYFNRTPASASNRRTWTWSGWVKRGALTSFQGIFTGKLVKDDTSTFYTSSDAIGFLDRPANVTNISLSTAAVFRDPSAWYHIILVADTTNATSGDRLRLFVNGVRQTFSGTYPAQNYEIAYINNTVAQAIGVSQDTSALYFDGYLTEVNFIDGQALTPSSFGGYNTGTGVWEPRKYAGTYGTNGFYLNFQDNSGATATTIGKDSSGNSNNWTPNNISVTAGVTYDSMLDVPTNTSPTNANFSVLNPLNVYGATITNGNLQAATTNTSNDATNFSTVQLTSGKWYAEFLLGGSSSIVSTGVGVSSGNTTTTYKRVGEGTNGMMYKIDGNKESPSGASAYGATYTYGDLIGIALDLDASPPTITFYKNNSSQGSLNLNSGSASTGYVIGCTVRGSAVNFIANFGQRPFTYTPPTGFKSLNTYNLPDPTIASGDDFHKVYTYTGNGGGLQVGEIQKPASLFNLDRSLRFRSSNSASLSRTFSTPTNSTKFTWSGWVKRGALNAVRQGLIGRYIDGNNSFRLFFDTNDTLILNDTQSASTICNLVTSAVFRDPSIWYHIVLAVDTSNGTAANKNIIYVNGIQMTFSSTTNYSSGSLFNIASAANTIALTTDAGPSNRYLDGYLADVYFIDGQQLAPTDFGAYDGNYYWTPKAYTGTYGTNGFHLEFEDFSAATAATIGKDTSGNVNNWTPSGISVTAGNTYDSMTDVPTLTSATTANYCVINPLGIGVPSFKNATSLTISNGNLSYSKPSATGYFGALGTFATPPTGKWYWEFTPTTNVITCGISVSADYASSGEFGVRVDNTTILVNGSSVQTGLAGLAVNDVIGCAWNADSNSFQFYKNGSTYGTAVPFIPASGASYYPYLMNQGTGISVVANANFGQRPFAYTPPTGFKELNSLNIAEVTDDLESPDFVWIKSRSAATGHALFNSVTGVGKYLSSNATTAETTDVNSLIQFNKNGFLLGNAAIVNTSAATYVASAWKGGSTTVTNTSGSISSQVRANQKAGFSIVTYTGNGSSSATVGHGLGVVPAMVITKGRSTSTEWMVKHQSLPTGQNLILNQTLSAASSLSFSQGVIANLTSSTTFGFTAGGSGVDNANQSGVTFVAYCFSEIAGFSKFGSYTGNGSADGPFVYLGFRPSFLIIKRTDAVSTWYSVNKVVNGYNSVHGLIYPNLSSAESTINWDILSNGFKMRDAGADVNGSGGTFIYMAFADNPFKYALAR